MMHQNCIRMHTSCWRVCLRTRHVNAEWTHTMPEQCNTNTSRIAHSFMNARSEKPNYFLNQKQRPVNLRIRRLLNTTSVTSTLNVRPLKITSRLAAEQLVRDMTEDERNKLFGVLQDLEQELLLEQGIQEKVPTFNQLWLLAFTNSIPFIGFGFLDNAIMILAGEYIDYTVGAALGISTMAAAAIGNMISDIAGIGLAGYVEVWACRLGFEEPNLTPLQLTMRQSRIACHMGRAVGIMIGCVIGMLPLYFITPVSHDHVEGSDEGSDQSTQQE